MRNIYYILWVDAIVNAKDYKNKEPGWKSSVFWTLTTINVFNLMLVLFWLDFFQIYKHKFIFNFNANSFALGLLEAFLNVFVPFVFVPFAFVNYFAIFYKDRYKRLIEKYSHYDGRFALYYTLISIFLLVITVVLIW